MSVSAVGSGGAYAYLQSLLQQQRSSTHGTGSGNPIDALLAAFYPNGTGAAPDSTTTATGATPPASNPPGPPAGGAQFSPNTMGAMISLQGQQGWTDRITAKAQSIFQQFDANGDGAISKSEFESAFGSNADMSKVDGLFSALDANGDGAISSSELTSAAQQSHAHHHHHHHTGNAESGGSGDPLAALASALQGASSKSTANADGSTTTTITYADGSTVTMSIPAVSSSNSSSGNAPNGNNSAVNILEQLIKLQAQMLAQSASAITSTTPAV